MYNYPENNSNLLSFLLALFTTIPSVSRIHTVQIITAISIEFGNIPTNLILPLKQFMFTKFCLLIFTNCTNFFEATQEIWDCSLVPGSWLNAKKKVKGFTVHSSENHDMMTHLKIHLFYVSCLLMNGGIHAFYKQYAWPLRYFLPVPCILMVQK